MSNRSPLCRTAAQHRLDRDHGRGRLAALQPLCHRPRSTAAARHRRRARAFEGEKTGFLNVLRRQSRRSAEKQPPLVLIHSINAAGSRPTSCARSFEAYRGKRDVYALDLPGFGFSERADRVYSPDLYKDAILALLDRIGTSNEAPPDVIALSLGCEFAARAALECPDDFPLADADLAERLHQPRGETRLAERQRQGHERYLLPDILHPSVGASLLRPDRHAAEHPLLPEAELRRARSIPVWRITAT